MASLLGPADDSGPQDRGQRFWRFDTVAGPLKFVLPVSPGIEVMPLKGPLALGDQSSRLRIIDARMGATAYTLEVEGRRGRAYSVRLRVPFPIASIDGATANTPDGQPLRAPVQELVIRFPPASPEASGSAPSAEPARTSRQRDWATQVVRIRFVK